MRKTKTSCHCPHFRVRVSKNLAERRTIWLDLWGQSYVNVANTPDEAQKIAKKLREAADWIETNGTKYLTDKNHE